jgi:hypothetical protein
MPKNNPRQWMIASIIITIVIIFMVFLDLY